jgi:hypothetical protein
VVEALVVGKMAKGVENLALSFLSCYKRFCTPRELLVLLPKFVSPTAER